MTRGKLKHAYVAALLGIGVISIDHVTSSRSVRAQAIRNTPPLEASQPASTDELRSAVKQTAAIVEGWVSDIQHEYSDEEGPWTRVTLSDVQAHFGAAPDVVEIRQFGGPLPNGRLLVAAELPVFVMHKQYLVFLRNTAWNVSPVVGDLALRVETVDQAEVLVNSDGQPVTDVTARGVGLGPAVFGPFEQIGQAPQLLDSKLASLDRTPLDRQRFVEALGATFRAQGLRVDGPFFDSPAGAFKWRGQATAAGPGRTAASDAADRSEPEPDKPGSPR